MAKVLTIDSEVLCDTAAPASHGGTIVLQSTAKLTVGKKPVLTESGIGPAVAKCLTPPPPATTKPCTSVATVAPTSNAQKLTVGKKPVILDSLTGATDGAPPGKLAVTANQDKLTAS